MTNEQFFEIKLPKWPCLIVKGQPVTKDQAKSILIRTDDLSFSTNDYRFAAELYKLFYGVSSDFSLTDVSLYHFFKKGDTYDWKECDKLEKKVFKELGKLDLEYLHNKRIVSSWIGGTHGWCSWNGYIGTNNYNIGKWPSVESVYNDWKKIARAFPFIDLQCQLLSGETCEEDNRPLIQFNVKKGKVKMLVPKGLIDYPNDSTDNFFLNFNSPIRERGCTIETVEDAIEYVKNEVRMAGVSKPQSTP